MLIALILLSAFAFMFYTNSTSLFSLKQNKTEQITLEQNLMITPYLTKINPQEDTLTIIQGDQQ